MEKEQLVGEGTASDVDFDGFKGRGCLLAFGFYSSFFLFCRLLLLLLLLLSLLLLLLSSLLLLLLLVVMLDRCFLWKTLIK